MTGLKSGAGDDLWGDDDADEEVEAEDENSSGELPRDTEDTERSGQSKTRETANTTDQEADAESEPTDETTHPYVVRRAIQNKSVQFERDERLTFFVHDDVVDGERELVSEFESTFGRNVPKFDIREAVYRAALQNPDDVLQELLEMGYTQEE